jgi:hypothetical protein
MFDLSWPNTDGQENDPPAPPVEPAPLPEKPRRRRADALMLSPDETKAVRVAIRKLRRALGGFNALAVATGISAHTLRRCANPKGARPTGTLAIRVAAAAKVPVEVLLGGKMVVAPVVIGRAA